MLRFVVTLFVIIIGISRAFATDYYVAQSNGNDTNSGTQSQPVRTITRAYSLAVAGDRILVQPGTYTDYQAGWALVLNKNGTANSPITIKSLQKGQAILNATGQNNRDNVLAVEGNYHIIDGFTMIGSKFTAVHINGSNNKFINNELHHNGKIFDAGHTGNQGFYDSARTSGNYYERNYIHDNGGAFGKYDHGFYLMGDNDTVVNNIVVGQTGNGLQIAGESTITNMKVYNNNFLYNKEYGIVLWELVCNVEIINNIVAWNNVAGIGSWDSHGSGVTISNNLTFGNTVNINLTGGGSDFTYTLGPVITANPLFVGSNDYHLQIGSPAIDAGSTLATITQDYYGGTRPQNVKYDIGASEYQFQNNPCN